MIARETSTGQALHHRSESLPVSDWRPLAAGALLTMLVLSRRSTLLTIGAIAGGGYLWYRAVSKGAIPSPAELVQRIGSEADESLSARKSTGVDEASMESFPASDPPARY